MQHLLPVSLKAVLTLIWIVVVYTLSGICVCPSHGLLIEIMGNDYKLQRIAVFS